MKEIKITDIPNIRIGQVEDAKAGTGCTAFICPTGMRAGLDVRGGGPASRETELLKPTAAAQVIHAVLMGGGSAFGLDAAGGVMQYLEEHDIGFPVGITKVPLVCQSDIFDLTVGDHTVRPGKEMGYRAAKAAMEEPNYRDGNFGAGCGASVGKCKGMGWAMKAGIGSNAVQIGDLQVGAVVAVNALGDIYDWKNGQKLAGVRDPETGKFESAEEILCARAELVSKLYADNTTIGIVITNGKLDKTQLCKVAAMTHNGYARSIRPVHTSGDGDSIYAVSVGEVVTDTDVVGTLAAQVMSEAIIRAVTGAEPAYGLPAYSSIR